MSQSDERVYQTERKRTKQGMLRVLWKYQQVFQNCPRRIWKPWSIKCDTMWLLWRLAAKKTPAVFIFLQNQTKVSSFAKKYGLVQGEIQGVSGRSTETKRVIIVLVMTWSPRTRKRMCGSDAISRQSKWEDSYWTYKPCASAAIPRIIGESTAWYSMTTRS